MYLMTLTAALTLAGACSQSDSGESGGMTDTATTDTTSGFVCSPSTLTLWLDYSATGIDLAGDMFSKMSSDEIEEVYLQLVDYIVHHEISDPLMDNYCTALVYLQGCIFNSVAIPDRFQEKEYDRFKELYRDEYPKTFDVIKAMPGGGEKYTRLLNEATNYSHDS